MLTLEELRKKLEKCWGVETCYVPMRKDYNKHNSSYGQCYPTALIVQDYFGGEILKVKFPEGGGHYWNLIDGKEVDLTRDQFDKNQIFPKPWIMKREDMIDNPKYKHDNENYRLLKKKLEALE